MADKQRKDSGEEFTLADLDGIELLFSIGDQLAGKEPSLVPDENRLNPDEFTRKTDNLVEETLQFIRNIEDPSSRTGKEDTGRIKEPAYQKKASQALKKTNTESAVNQKETAHTVEETSQELLLHLDTDRLSPDDLVFEKSQPRAFKKTDLNKQKAPSAKKQDKTAQDLETGREATISRENRGMVQDPAIGGDTVLKSFVKGIFPENPALFGALGLCPLLIAAQDTRSGFAVSLFAAFTFIWMALFSPFIHRFVPFALRPPVFALLGIGLYAGGLLLFPAFFETLPRPLYLYLPLVAVESIIAASFAQEPSAAAGVARAIGRGLGYTAVVMFVAELRELFILGTVFGRRVSLGFDLPVAALPFAALFIIAFAAALVRSVKGWCFAAKNR